MNHISINSDLYGKRILNHPANQQQRRSSFFPAQTLRLYNSLDEVGTFRNMLTFGGHTKAVNRATYGAATRLMYSCSRDTTLRQWNRSGISALRVFEGHDLACTAIALSEGGWMN